MAGLKDTLLPIDKSKELLTYFPNATFYEHSGGHYFSCTSETVSKLFEYLSI